MENNSSNKNTLANYLAKQKEKWFFIGTIERYLLAAEFINAYNDEFGDKKSTVARRLPFFNPENIGIENIACEDGLQRFKVVFPEFDYANDKSTLYYNIEYGHGELFETKNFIGKPHTSNLSEVWNRCNGSDKSDKYAVFTLATILFEIYFCCHPFKGREYYSRVTLNVEDDRDFFANDHKFIFDLQDNPNRFVNGPHSYAWTLWDQSTEAQREFWKNTFNNKKLTYKQFYESWRAAYGSYLAISSTYTPCNERLNVLVYGDDYALIPSNVGIGLNAIICRNCRESILNRCASSCPVSKDKQVTRFNKQAVTLCYRQTVTNADGSQEVNERQIKASVYDGKIIKTTDFCENVEDKELFSVITSTKRRDLLGLKCLTDDGARVTNDRETVLAPRNGVIALLPNTQIDVKDTYIIKTVTVAPQGRVAAKPNQTAAQGASDAKEQPTSTDIQTAEAAAPSAAAAVADEQKKDD